MEQEYLIDTNAVIDYLDDKLPEDKAILIDEISIQISVVTRMELLGWSNASNHQLLILQKFVDASIVYNLEEPVIVKTIDLRKIHKIKLPDAIIAATALVYNLTLVTRNIDDFKGIDGLGLMNPHQI